ncbi:MAG: hypothetical protein FVQ81_05155 [Candidatus Glassbacteria bacterium]|nr:hypothetical protein [Candidatus Glassbacteria bacterium]
MGTVERIISSLRRSGALILSNIWLLGWAFLYSFTGPVLLLGGTGLPVLYWWQKGRYFEPGLLFTDPAAFVLGHGQLILWSLAGSFVGFAIYIIVLLFYQGALTGVVARGIVPGEQGAGKVDHMEFWSEGSALFGHSMGTATLASLLPLLPGLALLAFVSILAFKVPDLVAGGLGFTSPVLIISVAGAVVTGLLTVLTGWLAFLWYQFALAAARVEGCAAGGALGRAWRFFTSRWTLVVVFVLAMILLGFLSWGVSAPFSMGGKFVRDWSAPLGMAMQIVGAPLGAVLGIFMNLWLKCALVVLFIDNR